MSGSRTVRELQERAARALPAEHVTDLDGWWLRHAPHCSWWIGTVLPHGDADPGDMARRITAAERFYTARGTTTRFQITPEACPPALDPLLAARGYHRESPISLQTARTTEVLTHTSRNRPGLPENRPDLLGNRPSLPEDRPPGLLEDRLRVELDERPTRAWFDVWCAVHAHDDPRPEWDLLHRVDQPSAYARALLGDEVIAVGRTVADTGWAGVFGMVTLPHHRGKGAAHTILNALATWSTTQNAPNMYLQAEQTNPKALHLYTHTTFTELTTFHYRTAK
ncbi:GNAT family N-acetyltransferase [Sphaerisporangium siamense]|uniref:GNAT superfamily N-acetyltransferase n=1 Tax=Sphaerisporangium siamense TaxID=795645 RepID=A0A7W7D265_9ACTN|nr:GNAT family N-acetyltransferase [Sphaerisporangium siamense]MBB4698897.1 GNAT superfamily N-acetyltransferase [Sphaerisporangium siamense]